MSPPGPRAKPDLPRVEDVDPVRRRERERQLALQMAEKELHGKDKKENDEKEKEYDAKAEFMKLISSRSGGVYIPPARLRALQAQITDKSSKEFQRMAWEALKKSINGLINKVNVSNIKFIVPESVLYLPVSCCGETSLIQIQREQYHGMGLRSQCCDMRSSSNVFELFAKVS